MNSLNEQKPATKNQITNNKPGVNKYKNRLTGYIANSINGGMLKPIAYRRIMAGEYDVEYKIRMNIKMLTPKTPAYQALKCTLKAYFVPDTAVWKNALKWASQKGGSTQTKVKEIPNLGSKSLDVLFSDDYTNDGITVFNTDTDLWRDSWVSTYFPKYQTGAVNAANMYATIPKLSVLPFRGAIKIYNEFERNKEYDPAITEYDGDTVSTVELGQLFSQNPRDWETIVWRGKRQNSYYTDYRTELLGEDIPVPVTGTGDLVTHTEWQKRVAELRSEAENAQLNDRDILAKLYGTRKLRDGYVELLGRKTFNLNYGVVNQSTYNVNSNVSAEYQALGTQGAYSYTEIEVPLYQFQEFKENGYIHVFMQVSADSVFETGFERTSLNVGVMDNYRPDLKELKHDVLYTIEKSGTRITATEIAKVDGFKRKFSEMFKLPNAIAGEMTTGGYYPADYVAGNNRTEVNINGRITSNHSFQFFEIDDRFSNFSTGGQPHKKKIWRDYSDCQINENLAVMEQEQVSPATLPANPNEGYLFRIKGQNQIFFVGMHEVIADLPIDEAIKENFTLWGEE